MGEGQWLGENMIEAGYGLYLYRGSSQAYNNYSYLKENMKENLDDGKILKDKYVLKIFEAFEEKTNQL